MAKQIQLVAVGCVVINAPDGVAEFSGFDEAGSPIMRVPPVEIQPGETFTVDEADAIALLSAGAAHRPGHEPPLASLPATDWRV